MKKYIFIFILGVLFVRYGNAQVVLNGDFEKIDKVSKNPENWVLYANPFAAKSYAVKLDSVVKQHGRYSILMERIAPSLNQNTITYNIPEAAFDGKTITLRGYIKIEGLEEEGYAGLWFQLNNEQGKQISRYIDNQGAKGTSDWKQYSIELPNRSDVKIIQYGGILAGGGKAWFDNLELLIDGVPMERAKAMVPKKAATDTAFSKGSQINHIAINPQQITNLAIVGQFWAFLKYHHPAIVTGDYNWDAELFRLLPLATKAKNNNELSSVLEKYLIQFPIPPLCKTCNESAKEKVLLRADYGELLDGKILSNSLVKKLVLVRDNRSTGENYWIGKAIAGQALFKHEKAYENMAYPDMGYRLLSLYRYWAMINYYYPNRDVIGEDWSKGLRSAIPDFILAANQKEYTIAVLKLISSINDTHAAIGLSVPFNLIAGKYVAPFQAKFIEDKLVLTGFYVNTPAVRENLKVGDLILAINGKTINDLLKTYLPITPASNYDRKLNDLPATYLLRSHETTLKIAVQRGEQIFEYNVPMIDQRLALININYTKPTGYYLINDEIGYVYGGKYKNSELPAIKKDFEKTKGIIIDLRVYPSESMINTLANYIKAIHAPFAIGSEFDFSKPGSFTMTRPISNGAPTTDYYKGKVIILVNAVSQSRAEFTAMAFQGAANVRILGSQTSGADGDFSTIILPGNISTGISGIGVFYPDLSPTQRVGVKIDEWIKPTIKGILENKDELLEKAVELIKKGG